MGGVAGGFAGFVASGLSCLDRVCGYQGIRVVAGVAVGALMGAVVGGTIGAGLQALEDPPRR